MGYPTPAGKVSQGHSPRLIFSEGDVAHNHDQKLHVQLTLQLFNYSLLLHAKNSNAPNYILIVL